MSISSTGLSHDELKPLTVTVNTVCALSGLGPTKVWELIKQGRLGVVRIDGRTLVKFPSLERLLALDSKEETPTLPAPSRPAAGSAIAPKPKHQRPIRRAP